MSHVQIATIDHRLLCIQGTEVFPQGVLPGHTVVQPCQLPLGVGGVDAHQVKILVFQGDGSALRIMLGNSQAVGHGKGLVFGKDSRTGIALLFGAVPILKIALRGKFRLAGLHFGLLQAEEVRIRLGKEIGKALPQAGAEAVNIPRNKFHKNLVQIKDSKRVTVSANRPSAV